MFFLGPLCEGAPPAGGGGENLFPGDYDYIRQGRGHNVCLAVSRDGEHIDSNPWCPPSTHQAIGAETA